MSGADWYFHRLNDCLLNRPQFAISRDEMDCLVDATLHYRNDVYKAADS